MANTIKEFSFWEPSTARTRRQCSERDAVDAEPRAVCAGKHTIAFYLAPRAKGAR